MYAPKKENPYLNMTPMALRRSLQMIGLARSFASREIKRMEEIVHYWDADMGEKTWQDADITRGFLEDLALFHQEDAELWATAMQINACCIAFCTELLD